MPDDDKPGAPPVVLLSYRGWLKLFGGDPAVVGKTAEIDGEQHTVIGVMPPDFVLPGGGGSGALWTALRLSAADFAAPNVRSVRVTARLRPSITLAAAQAALDSMSASLPPGPDGAVLRVHLAQWRDETDPDRRLTIWLAMGMVSGLLIISCANLASILLARAISRRRDYAIRLATGASRLRLIRQSLLEICTLALVSLILASAGASVALSFIRNGLADRQPGIPDLARIHLSGTVLLFSFAISLAAALICGLYPAFASTSIDLSTGLRDFGAHAGSGRSSRRFLHALLAVEAAISMLLLMTSGVLVRSLARLLSDDHGLKPDRVLTLHLPTGSWQRLPRKQTEEDRRRRIQQYLDLMRQAESIHGVEAAALSSSLPLSHAAVRTSLEAPSGRGQIMPVMQSVTSDYFRAMGIPFLSGRTFTPADAASKVGALLW
jgi:predicted permease